MVRYGRATPQFSMRLSRVAYGSRLNESPPRTPRTSLRPLTVAPTQTASATDDDDVQRVAALAAAREQIIEAIRRKVVGQDEVIEQLLVALFAGGHCLLVGVPGLAKTLMVHALADALSLDFTRVQFTPDLMPSDITGADVFYEDKATGERAFRFVPGPIFANVLLADEINRTPPKTQAALLEAMQERQVTAGGKRHPLPSPFFTLATQNPIDQEGTYPLPEAQLDRFMMQVNVVYPNEAEELEIVRRTTADTLEAIQPVLSAEEIAEHTRLVRRTPIAPHIDQFAVTLVRKSRHDQPEAPEYIREFVRWGAGPRASQWLVLAAKARATLSGRYSVDIDDIRAMAAPVLRHRIKTNFSADAEGVTPDDLIARLMKDTPDVPDRKIGGARLSSLFAAGNDRQP